MRGLPSTRATSGRAANASATCARPLHKDCVNNIEGLVLQALTQPLQDWPLSRLSLVEKGLEHEPSLLGFRPQVRGRAQVGLVIQSQRKIPPAAVGRVFHDPRRDLARWKRAGRARRGYGGLPRGAMAPTITTKAAKRSSEEKTRRQRDGANLEIGCGFVIIGLPVVWIWLVANGRRDHVFSLKRRALSNLFARLRSSRANADETRFATSYAGYVHALWCRSGAVAA